MATTNETTPMWCNHCRTITAHLVNPRTLVDQCSVCDTASGDSGPYVERTDEQ